MTIPLKTIVIAEDEKGLCAQLRQGLTQLGYDVLGVASNGTEAIEMVKLKSPQVILMDVNILFPGGLEAAKRIVELQKTALVLLTGEGNSNLAREALETGIGGFVQKTCAVDQITPILETAWHQFQVVTDLHKQVGTLTESLETRKLLEKAKGILIEQQGLSEELAHQVIQKMSQEQGIAIKEVCRSIIQVKMVLGKSVKKHVV